MSTLERPAYRVSIENVDQGWTHTIEHREAPPAWEDVTALLIDDFTMGWGLAGPPPSQMASDTVSFKFYARFAEHVPVLEVGDLLEVNLDRPGPDGTLIPYMHFVGRTTDPQALAVPGRGITLTVGAVGILLDLVGELDRTDATAVGGFDVEYDLMTRVLHYHAGLAIAEHYPRQFTRLTAYQGRFSLQEYVTRALNGAVGPNGAYAAVLRYARNWVDTTGNWATFPTDYGTLVHYYMQKWLLKMPPPLNFVSYGRRVALGPNAETVDQITTLSSSYIDAPTDWTKSRDDLVNIVNITYTAALSGDPITGPEEIGDKVASVQDNASRNRYGPAQIDVATLVIAADVNDVAQAYLNGSPGSLAWSVPQLVVHTKLMDDDELDQLAPTFFPHPLPREDTAGRFFIVTEIDELTAIAGTAAAMQLVGATFSISRGDLTITCNMRPMPTPSFATSITYDDIAGTNIAPTFWQYPTVWGDLEPLSLTYDDVPTDAVWTSPSPTVNWLALDQFYIDPALDWDELTYTD
ncbi:hypothetical protein [Aeromicrobium fastidiosum]|uniref:Uncharacterized protein n=1 Tax=Aeromicrobium fastidiosum TaxID=52699 RepID=A0A641AQZ2_9ACTN|nr:hypothetical protein [Aeromicrobium fastidiosum]KAA1380524.1 hypothetical protein ESP62_004930 [Aeromicrobium fastidiosum]MBP2390116.1 hypothetical protein [Aeromicrobium fastidiosum]